MARGRRYGIVHVHCSERKSVARKFFYMAVALLAGKRLFIQIHPERFAAFFRKSPGPVRGLMRSVFDKSQAIIVLTRSLREKMQELFPRDPIVVLGNPVDCAAFAARPDVPAEGVLFMGAVSAEKGIWDILAVVPEVAAMFPAASFLFCGPVRTPEIREAFQNFAASDLVRWTPWVDGAEKVDAYHRSRMVILPSYTEGLPNVILEAMASSLPVISTPVGGIPDIVTDGVNGFLIAPGDRVALKDRILELLGDRDLCRKMGMAGRRIVEEKYDIEVVGRALLGIYGSPAR